MASFVIEDPEPSTPIEKARWILHEHLFETNEMYRFQVWDVFEKKVGYSSSSMRGKAGLIKGVLDEYICSFLGI